MSTPAYTVDRETIRKRLDSMVQNTHYDQLVVVESLSRNGTVSINTQRGKFKGNLFCSSKLLDDASITDEKLVSVFDFVLCIDEMNSFPALAFTTTPRTPQELVEVRRLAADERVMCQLCHIARCDEAEIKRQVERTGRDIHTLRAFYLANGEWPKSKPIDKQA